MGGASMWRRFLWAFAITGAVFLALCLALILLVDPIGVSPIALATPKSGYAFKDRRFLAQQVIRSGRFDSYLVGSSTLHSVDPEWANAAFGGRFANVSIHGATLYELRRVVELAGRSVPDLRRVVLGLDVKRWCRAEPPRRYHRKAVFPEWLYDGSRLNDFEALLNMKMLNAAFAQLAVDVKRNAPAVPANGYRNELDDTKWAAFKAKEGSCEGGCDKHVALEEEDEDEPADAEESVRVYPALPWLRQAILSLPKKTEFIAVLMPLKASALARLPAPERNRIEACKQRIARLAARRHGTVVDFFVASDWTRNDDNFWDSDHLRVGFARALIFRVKEAVMRRRDADDGVYRVITGDAPDKQQPADAAETNGTPGPLNR